MCQQLRKTFVDINASQESEGQQLALKTKLTFEVKPDNEEAFIVIVLNDLLVIEDEINLMAASLLVALEVTIMNKIQVVLLMKVKEKVKTAEDQVEELRPAMKICIEGRIC